MRRPKGFQARDLNVFDLEMKGEPLIVISLPAIRNSEVTDGLTPAECEIARDVVAGLGNEAIAHQRGRSARTIANQLQSIYRKLGVSSRAELTALVLGKPMTK